MSDIRRRWSRISAIYMTPEIQATKNDTDGGGPSLVVPSIKDDVCLLEEGGRDVRRCHRMKSRAVESAAVEDEMVVRCLGRSKKEPDCGCNGGLRQRTRAARRKGRGCSGV